MKNPDHKGNILVVDDEAQITRVLKTTLSAQGYGVRTASDGHRALEEMKNWSPDMVIADLRMPNLYFAKKCVTGGRARSNGGTPNWISSNYYPGCDRVRGREDVCNAGDNVVSGIARHCLGRRSDLLESRGESFARRVLDCSRRVTIGLRPWLSAIAQPVAQIAAAVPATALFPIILLVLIRAGGGLGVGSVLLLLLGTQWYVLFNVIVGAMAIPADLKEVCSTYQLSATERWRRLFLPTIFPYLVTGFHYCLGRRMEREHRG